MCVCACILLFKEQVMWTNTLPQQWVEGHSRITNPTTFLFSAAQCSTECGGGTQQREIICVRKTEGNFDVLNPYECSYLERPPSQQSCYLKPCGSKWFHTEWSTVSLPCFSMACFVWCKCAYSWFSGAYASVWVPNVRNLGKIPHPSETRLSFFPHFQ